MSDIQHPKYLGNSIRNASRHQVTGRWFWLVVVSVLACLGLVVVAALHYSISVP